jgi:hypothetical protein
MKKILTSTDTMTIHDPVMWIDKLGTEPNEYYRGVVFTKQGIVAVYRQDDHTRLDFVWRGKWYSRQIPAAYSDRYTITLANRFAGEVVRRFC